MIDIGVNLTHEAFAADRAEVVARAQAAGVEVLIVTGTDVAHSRAAAALAADAPHVLYSTAGIHPHEAAGCDARALRSLAELAAAPQVVAIGECGLDFNRDYAPRAAQERAFEAQLELAAELGLPVFLHQRDAHARFVAMLGRHRDRLAGAVAHCFTGDREALAAYLDLDLHIGVTGWICDERRGHGLRDSIAAAPLDRVMIETDAPYLLPRDLHPRPRSRRNEPMYLPHVCAAVAGAMGRPVEAVAAATARTARALFRLPGG